VVRGWGRVREGLVGRVIRVVLVTLVVGRGVVGAGVVVGRHQGRGGAGGVPGGEGGPVGGCAPPAHPEALLKKVNQA